MSVLTEALDRILDCWRRQHREYIQTYSKGNERPPFLLPGLSLTEIETITKNLNFQLPPELYELYQWCNGVSSDKQGGLSWLFDIQQVSHWYSGIDLMPLQSAVDEYIKDRLYPYSLYPNIFKKQNLIYSQYLIKQAVFRIFTAPECTEGVLIINWNLQYFPVVFRNFKGGVNEIIIIYTSLTNMMLTIAECYEQAYYRNSEGRWIQDDQKAKKIGSTVLGVQLNSQKPYWAGQIS